YGQFKLMSEITGKNSNEKKRDIIKRLLVECQGHEAKYLIRQLSGNLHIGLAEKSVLQALARAVTLTPPVTKNNSEVVKAPPKNKLKAAYDENKRLIDQAYIEVPNYDIVLSTLLDYGVALLPVKCQLKPGVPVKVMLGKPSNSIQAVTE